MSSSKNNKKGIVFTVSGPSGSGKTTLCKRLLSQKSLRSSLCKTVSVTTRPKRRGEREGRDYQFISKKEFLRREARGQLLENQKVFGFFYGTPKDSVEDNLKKGKDVLLCIDVKGARAVKKIYPEASGIFIMPPSIAVLKQRLKKRSTETQRHMLKRLKIARWEMGFAKKYNYVIINDKLKAALEQLKSVIRKERTRRSNEAQT